MSERLLGPMFRGTGGVEGEDYVSLVCQAVSELVEEVHPEFPATMGGLPVGTAGSPSDPSMQRAVSTAFEDAKRIFLARHALNPNIGVVIGGYSAGAVAAALFRQWLLESYAENYCCSFSIGDPTRPSKGAFFAGAPAPGHGISTWRYGDVADWRHCWLSQKGDMYTSVPEGDTGLILGDFYDIISRLQLSDPLGTFGAILEKLPNILTHLGILGEGRNETSAPLNNLLDLITKALFQSPKQQQDLLGGLLSGNPDAWASIGLGNPKPLIFHSLTGLLDGEPDYLAAGINAAIVATKFAAAGTTPHTSYESTEVWPGQTYLGLAAQHVRDWASRFNQA